MKKLGLSALIATLLLFLTPLAATQAGAQAAEEAAFVASINNVRAQNGLPALTVHGELTGLSRTWAQSMANAGQISHASPISAGLTAPWLKLGENVGVGPSVSALVDAFVASPGHFANIVDPEFTHIGVGVVWVGDIMYTTHRFMKLEAAPAPTTTTTAAPAPTTTTTTAAPTPPPTAAPTSAAPTATQPPATQPPVKEPAATQPSITLPPLALPDDELDPLPLFGSTALDPERLSESLAVAYTLLD